MAGPLTPKQQRFVEEYLVDLNATAAYKRAGYAADGNAAEVNASRLLSNAKVQEAVQSARQTQSDRTQITQDYVLQRLKKEAEREGEGSSHAARVRAAELLGKHLGMFDDKLDINLKGPPFKVYMGFDPQEAICPPS